MQIRYLREASSTHFFAKGNSIETVALQVANAWQASQSFDNISGLETNVSKTFIFANSQLLEDTITQNIAELPNGVNLRSQQSCRLVGSVITVRGRPQIQTRATRVANTLTKLQRIRRAPVRFIHKIKLAEAIFSGAVFGSEIQECSVSEHNTLRGAVTALLWNGNVWLRSFAITFSHIVPPFRLLLQSAGIYHAVNLTRRLLVRRLDLHPIFIQTWNCGHVTHGPVARLRSAISELHASWEAPFVIRTNAGTELFLLSEDKARFQHDLREAIRDMVIRNDPPIHTRKDMEGGPPFLYQANTALLRNSEKNQPIKRFPVLNLFERATLRNIMTGTTRTAERLVKAGSLTTAICPWCDKNVHEDHDHFFWKCPAWQEHRRNFFRKWDVNFIFDLPPCTRHCALLPSSVLEDETFSSLQEATAFVVDLQTTMIAVTHARDKAKASTTYDVQEDQPDLESDQINLNSDNEPSDVGVKTTSFDPHNLYPSYPWSYEQNFSGHTFFQARIPENWRRYSKGGEWIWVINSFHPLHWFWSQLQWPDEPCEGETISWLELALSFHAATHCSLSMPDVSTENLTIASISSFFRNAGRRMAKIYNHDLCPAEILEHTNSLTALGFQRLAGLSKRPKMLRPEYVHFHLLEIARQSQHATIKARSAVIRLHHAPPILYVPQTKKRMWGKQPAPAEYQTQKTRRIVKSHKATMQGVAWTDHEIQVLQQARDWRDKQRLQKIIVHNRSADTEKKHKLPLNEHTDVHTCEKCPKHQKISLGFSRILVEVKQTVSVFCQEVAV